MASLTLVGGTAGAAPLPTCGEASVLLQDASAALDKAQADFDAKTAAASKATSDLSALKVELAGIQAKLATVPPTVLTALETLRLPALPGLINSAGSDDTAAQTALATSKANLDKAKAAKAQAIDVRNAACAVVPPVDDQNCPDFATQALAQAHLVADKTDPDNLDSDKDGTACEEFFAAAPTTTLKAPVPTVVIDKVVVTNPQFRTIPNVARGVQTG